MAKRRRRRKRARHNPIPSAAWWAIGGVAAIGVGGLIYWLATRKTPAQITMSTSGTSSSTSPQPAPSPSPPPQAPPQNPPQTIPQSPSPAPTPAQQAQTLEQLAQNNPAPSNLFGQTFWTM